VHDPAEVLTEISGRAEPGVLCHHLDGQVGRLEELLRKMDALAL
jgi:hypothetical protein